MNTAVEDGVAVRRAVGIHRQQRGFSVVEGLDATRFLQGMVTNDVGAIATGDAAYALLLTPKARVLADLRIVRVAEDRYLLESEPAAAPVIRQTLLRYRLRARVTIEQRDDAFGLIAVAGPKSGMLLADAFGVLPLRDVPEGAGTEVVVGAAVLHAIASVFCGDKAFDLVGERDACTAAFAQLSAALVRYDGVEFGEEAHEALRIEAGIPRYGAEIDERVFPAEIGLVERAVSFTKGCYTGQEPVARLHYRGHANRGLRGLLLDGPVPPRDAVVLVDGRDVGRITSAAPSPTLGGVVALAIVRREVAADQEVTIRWDAGEVAGRLAEVPTYR